ELGCPYSRIPVDRERLEMECRLVGSPDGIRRVGIAQDTSRPRFPVPTGSVAVKLEDDSGATTRPVLRNRCDGSLHHDVVSGFQRLHREHLGDRSGPKNLPRRERGDDDGDRREESDQLPAASFWACGRGACRRSLHGLTDHTERPKPFGNRSATRCRIAALPRLDEQQGSAYVSMVALMSDPEPVQLKCPY